MHIFSRQNVFCADVKKKATPRRAVGRARGIELGVRAWPLAKRCVPGFRVAASTPRTRESINVVDAERQALLEPIAPRERAPFWQVALALVIVQASLLHVHVQTQNFQSSHKITATGPTALTLHSDATANMLGTNAPCAPPTPVRSNLPPFPFLSILFPCIRLDSGGTEC